MTDRDDAYFWEGAKEGRLLLRRCAGCGRLAHPPVPMCGDCHSLAWTTEAASGRGTVYTWLVSKHPSQPDAHPRIVALVDLAEGVRIVSNLRDVDVDDVRDGMPVAVFFEEVNGHVLPQFRPAGEAA
ncbi:MAG: OB-fold domain-containing protein [Myxococcota bacterium]|nr:OB-fold domain-containing protein [Myxococcales bacterium]